MNAIGTKVANRYQRKVTAFEELVEIGVVVPMNDSRFLEAYAAYTLDQDYAVGVTSVEVNETLSGNLNTDYVKDLDGALLRNGIVGPSTDSTARNTIQIRPAHKHASLETIVMDENMQEGADTLRMAMKENDNLIMAALDDDYDADNLSAVIRKPKLMNVADHANTLMLKVANGISYLRFPVTADGSINPNFVYRFSFYYRASGSFTFIPFVEYQTTSGSIISTQQYASTVVNLSDTETSDFRLYQIAIPRMSVAGTIPDNCRRMRVYLAFTASSEPLMEIAYPLIEHSFYLSASSGFFVLPDPPTSIDLDVKYSGSLKTSPVGKAIPFDISKIFFSHPGRKLYGARIQFDLVASAYIRHMRMLEQMNLMGYSIAIRIKHPDLPPVMVGDIQAATSNPHYDYHVNNLNLTFGETT